jgi:ABC-type nitrate/sulfonate/bicarbonate transport system substrate-binding protein
VAEKEGLFEKEGLSVELVYFGSARDRDSAIMSGQVDAALHDPVGALMLIGNGVPIRGLPLLRRRGGFQRRILLREGSRGVADKDSRHIQKHHN